MEGSRSFPVFKLSSACVFPKSPREARGKAVCVLAVKGTPGPHFTLKGLGDQNQRASCRAVLLTGQGVNG